MRGREGGGNEAPGAAVFLDASSSPAWTRILNSGSVRALSIASGGDGGACELRLPAAASAPEAPEAATQIDDSLSAEGVHCLMDGQERQMEEIRWRVAVVNRQRSLLERAIGIRRAAEARAPARAAHARAGRSLGLGDADVALLEDAGDDPAWTERPVARTGRTLTLGGAYIILLLDASSDSREDGTPRGTGTERAAAVWAVGPAAPGGNEALRLRG